MIPMLMGKHKGPHPSAFNLRKQPHSFLLRRIHIKFFPIPAEGVDAKNSLPRIFLCLIFLCRAFICRAFVCIYFFYMKNNSRVSRMAGCQYLCHMSSSFTPQPERIRPLLLSLLP